MGSPSQLYPREGDHATASGIPRRDTIDEGVPLSTPARTAPITSGSPLRKNVRVVTVESFYKEHGAALQLKLEGEAVGFHRKIREPT
ncbi:MAG: hypothetical protein M3Y69_01715, partial [Verrucomicrobiota bacterium]|nr:hypothetical protein [Verrucomicrobiota bacterium]